jgi:hypothetical protein
MSRYDARFLICDFFANRKSHIANQMLVIIHFQKNQLVQR